MKRQKQHIPSKLSWLSLLPFLGLLAPLYAQQDPCIGEQGRIEWLLFENIPDDELDVLRAQPNFPYRPDRTVVLRQLATPSNYNEDYGGLLRGFLRPDTTGYFRFNVTGDDESQFFLSSDTTRDELQLLAEVSNWSNEEEHYKYEEQTSDSILLLAGQYYYFEALYKEGYGGDFIRVHWQLPGFSSQDSTWTIIPGEYLFRAECIEQCPAAGQACDDGDASTVSDRTDGLCGCLGEPVNLPPCIGQPGQVEILYFDSLGGSSLGTLLEAPAFPLMPDRSETIYRFQKHWVDEHDNFGARVRTWLLAPESGYYQFLLTTNERGLLFLDSTDVIDYELSEIAEASWTGEYDFVDDEDQRSDSIYLEKGQFYYLEVLFKESGWVEGFGVFWRRPLQQDTLWKVIDGPFLYSYGCEQACIPQGNPCDDGNVNTFDDQYDNNCNCVGVPCETPGCGDPDSGSGSYTAYDNCAATDQHSTTAEDAWISCQTGPNPNLTRGNTHWLMYDLGNTFELNTVHIWNYNVEGQTGSGFRDVYVDYSNDGINWETLGFYQWPEASGNPGYSGFDFNELRGIRARYILFTPTDNFDTSTCMGLSEIEFMAYACPPPGQSCDDGQVETAEDMYDGSCNCHGLPQAVNYCSVSSRDLDGPMDGGLFDAEQSIQTQAEVSRGSSVTLVAGESIRLLPGFRAEAGSNFRAVIQGCEVPEPTAVLPPTTTEAPPELESGKLELAVHPNPALSWTRVHYYLPEEAKADLFLVNSAGQRILTLLYRQHSTAGHFTRELPVQRLSPGLYILVLQANGERTQQRLVVITD